MENTSLCRHLHTLSYHGFFPQIQAKPFAEYVPTHQGGVPLIVYNASDATLPMLVFSPLTFPKAQHMDATSQDSVGIGVKDTVESIPANHSHLAILSSGNGINAGMLGWGDRMLKFHGVKRRTDKYRDQAHSTLAGPQWRLPSLCHRPVNGTYEQVLPQVQAHHDQLGPRPLAVRPWFYPKDGDVGPGGGGGGVTN